MPAHNVHISIDREPRSIPPGLTKGQALIEIAALSATDQLLLEVDGDIDIPVGPDDFIAITGGETFSVGDGQPRIPDNPTIRKPIPFVLNEQSQGEHKCFHRAKATGADIKAIVGETNAVVWLDLDGFADERIDDTATLILRPNYRFFTVPVKAEHGCQDEHARTVQITLDSTTHQIKSGVYQVSELKHILSVPSDYELDLVVNGLFQPLVDSSSITIVGCEVFVSHVRRGGSS